MAATAVVKMLGLAKSMLKEESALGGVFQETKNRGGGREVHNDQFVDAAVGLSITRKIKRGEALLINELKG